MRKIHGLLVGISLLTSISALAVGEDDPNNNNSSPSKLFNGGTIHEEYLSDFDLLPAEALLNIFRIVDFNDLNSLFVTSKEMRGFLLSNSKFLMQQNLELLKYYMRLDMPLDTSKPSERYVNKLATLVRWFSNTPEFYSNPVFKIMKFKFTKDLSTLSKLYDKLNEKEEKAFLGKLSSLGDEVKVKLNDPDCIAKLDEYFKHYPFATYLIAKINSEDNEKLRGVLNLEHVKMLRHLLVYGDKLEGDNLNLFMQKLKSMHNLKILSLYGAKLTSDNSDGLIEYINENKKLEAISLHGVTFAEGKLMEVIKAISENIKNIFLFQCGINDTVLPDVMNLLVNKKIDTLDLSDNSITEVGIKNIANFPSELKELDFSENDLFDVGLKALCEKIINHPILRELRINDCSIESSNQRVVSDVGIDALVELLKKNQVLKSIGLSEHALTNGQVLKILDAILVNKTIAKLKLKEVKFPNNWCTEDVFKKLTEHNQLKVVDLSDNGLVQHLDSEDKLGSYVFMELLTQLINSVPTLEKLKFKYVGLNLGQDAEKYVSKLLEAIKKHPTLRLLNLKQNTLSPEIEKLLEAFNNDSRDKRIKFKEYQNKEEDE